MVLGRTDPALPVEPLGQPLQFGQLGNLTRGVEQAHGGPGVDLADLSEQPLAHPRGEGLMAGERMSLIAHVGHHVVAARGLHQPTHFPHRAGDRLLGVDMLAELHGLDRWQRVPMVRRRHKHRIDALAGFVVHLAVVGEGLHGRQELPGRREAPRIDIRHGHNLPETGVGQPFEIGPPLSADADRREAHGLAGRCLAAACDQSARKN